MNKPAECFRDLKYKCPNCNHKSRVVSEPGEQLLTTISFYSSQYDEATNTETITYRCNPCNTYWEAKRVTEKKYFNIVTEDA